MQEKRTSIDLSPDDSLCFSNNFNLSFDINFLPHHAIYFGYIFRIIAVGPGGNEQNIDLLYNQRVSNFKVIIGDNFSGISFTVDSLKLYRDWNNFSVAYDLQKHQIQFSVNRRVVGSSPVPATGNCFKILWGANDYGKFRTRDIPPMELKDIRIADNGTPKYDWPLDETAGEAAKDKLSHRAARIKNPVWLKPRYQQWSLIGSFTVNGYAGVAYNPKQDKLFVAGSDSIASYELTKDGYMMDWLPIHHTDLRLGHQLIYDTANDKLLDIFIDRHMVATFSFATRSWDQSPQAGPLTEYWHANKFVSPLDSSLYVIGGYGQLRYKNLVQRYHFPTRHWDTVKTSGDYLAPRYLAALGTDAEGKYAYLVGGYGSKTGDQMLDPRNFYDLFRYDIKRHSFHKLYSLKSPAYPFTFANSLVIAAKPDTWYGLLFPNDSYNSKLQLVEGTFSDSTFRQVGNSIPYSFHDIQSYADLYYSPLSNKLIAVTLFYTKDDDKERNTQVRVYTLNSPPEPVDMTAAVVSATPARGYRWVWGIVVLGGLIFVSAIMIRRRKRRGTSVATNGETGIGTRDETAREKSQSVATIVEHVAAPSPVMIAVASNTALQEAGAPASAIYLFGPFQVFDREGHDVTRQFTPLLKELFLIIATYTIRNGRGISSEGLNEILWHDKAEKDAKNNRSVNLAKLKPILEKVGNCVINKESGYWQLQVLDETYIDYKACVLLMRETGVPDTRQIHALVNIIKRGPFLLQTEYNWLDDIKSEISNAVIDRCLSYLREHDIMENPEFSIEITNCIFYFDQLNEDALTYKCKGLILLKRHNLASNMYLKFVKDYRDIYSADFDKSFQEIIS